jgi:hypothetical protein
MPGISTCLASAVVARTSLVCSRCRPPSRRRSRRSSSRYACRRAASVFWLRMALWFLRLVCGVCVHVVVCARGCVCTWLCVHAVVCLLTSACASATVCARRQSPARRVGLVVFNGDVTIYGDCSRDPRVIAGDNLSNYDALVAAGTEYLVEQPVSVSGDALLKKVFELEETGPTALGPAVLVSVAMASRTAGGKVGVVCPRPLLLMCLCSLSPSPLRLISFSRSPPTLDPIIPFCTRFASLPISLALSVLPLSRVLVSRRVSPLEHPPPASRLVCSRSSCARTASRTSASAPWTRSLWRRRRRACLATPQRTTRCPPANSFTRVSARLLPPADWPLTSLGE